MRVERRADERANVSLEVRWEGLSGQHAARLNDISLGGCFIDAAGIVSDGELIIFEIKLPSGEWLPLRGEVAFHQPNVGFSLSFPYLTDEEQRNISQLVELYK